MRAAFTLQDKCGFRGGDVNLQRYVRNNPTNAIDPSGLVWRFIEFYGNTPEFTRLGLPVFQGAMDEVKRILQDAVGRFAESGSRLYVQWPEVNARRFEGTQEGWVPLGPGMMAPVAAFVMRELPTQTVRIKVDVTPRAPIGSRDPYGYGEDETITLFSDPIKGEFDNPKTINKNFQSYHKFIGDVIAHELVHALGKSGHWHTEDPGKYIDGSPQKLGGKYSDEAAEYVVGRLRFPPK